VPTASVTGWLQVGTKQVYYTYRRQEGGGVVGRRGEGTVSRKNPVLPKYQKLTE